MFAEDIDVGELVGQPVRVVWADWRRGRRLGGTLTLTGISSDSERFYFRGRHMAFLIGRQWVVSLESCGS